MGKWDEKWKEHDDKSGLNVWGHANSSRSDEFANHDGDGADHCHLYNNRETGERGVVHRGTCAVCHDNQGKPFDNTDKRNK